MSVILAALVGGLVSALLATVVTGWVVRSARGQALLTRHLVRKLGPCPGGCGQELGHYPACSPEHHCHFDASLGEGCVKPDHPERQS